MAFRVALGSTLIVMMISLASCKKPETVAVGTTGTETQRTFASPSEAGAAFLDAAKSGDRGALLAIFGPDGADVLFSDDPAKDTDALAQFVSAYNTMNRWRTINAGGQMLFVGAENFPFPVPLQQDSSGRWYFDAAGGADEILARRIGRDELVAIAAVGAVANAQHDYFNRMSGDSGVKQYAQKLVSDQGTHDGLYWPAGGSPMQSPLGQLGDFAKGAGYTSAGGQPQPFDGYNFRILTKQGAAARGGAKNYVIDGNMTGGFAILAYPAEYQNSGIMTFLVGPDGIIYQKDLGSATSQLGPVMSEYNPGDGWMPVNEAGD